MAALLIRDCGWTNHQHLQHSGQNTETFDCLISIITRLKSAHCVMSSTHCLALRVIERSDFVLLWLVNSGTSCVNCCSMNWWRWTLTLFKPQGQISPPVNKQFSIFHVMKVSEVSLRLKNVISNPKGTWFWCLMAVISCWCAEVMRKCFGIQSCPSAGGQQKQAWRKWQTLWASVPHRGVITADLSCGRWAVEHTHWRTAGCSEV